MDTNRFDVWFDQNFPDWKVNHAERAKQYELTKRAWDAALIAQEAPKVVDGNARFAGFGKPATITPPNRPILPEPAPIDGLNIKHWNIWDTSKDRFAQTGLEKQAAYYWAQRYNSKEKRNIYIAVPMTHD